MVASHTTSLLWLGVSNVSARGLAAQHCYEDERHGFKAEVSRQIKVTGELRNSLE